MFVSEYFYTVVLKVFTTVDDLSISSPLKFRATVTVVSDVHRAYCVLHHVWKYCIRSSTQVHVLLYEVTERRWTQVQLLQQTVLTVSPAALCSLIWITAARDVTGCWQGLECRETSQEHVWVQNLVWIGGFQLLTPGSVFTEQFKPVTIFLMCFR